ncbi:MAG TPA: Nif3-like dinuclear metal center hexameric protein [Thermotogota bacterium]|nr:Nif3-like dinuclear metal center hexameric protein [Thermotogota bacterium]HRW93787.1 Nif3-like dinuclear metal center hexameric protein [Thermotogota bacterium]
MNTQDCMQIALDLVEMGSIPDDSGIHVPGKNIRKVLFGLDVDNAVLLYAKQNGYDLVVGHHPNASSVRLHKVFLQHVDFMVSHGVPLQKAQDAVFPKAKSIELSEHASNYAQVAQFAQHIGMPYINVHQPLDELGRRMLQGAIDNLLESKPDATVDEVVEVLSQVPELRRAKTNVEIRHGEGTRKAGKVVFSHGFGTNGGAQVAQAFFESGVDTVCYIHLAYPDLVKIAEMDRGTLIVTGHIASDSVGINPYLQALRKEGLQVDALGGVIA